MRSEKKMFDGKILGILSGGGDTPAVNSSIESVRNRAAMLGFKVYGIRNGWKGLLGDGDVLDLTSQPYDGLYGGTALRSSRTNPFPSKKNPESRVPQVLKNLKRYGLDILVTIGGDDTNGAAKQLYETEGIPVIGFPKTIDNDLRTKTMHTLKGQQIEAVICPGFPSAAKSIMDVSNRIRTTAESHARIMVVEVMGRDAGWLTGAAAYGGAEIALVPEFEITKEKKEQLFDAIKETYNNSPKKCLVLAVSEGARWYDEKTGKVDVVYASSEVDEFGHARFGGISGVIASEISFKLGIEARAQITGYYPRSGDCSQYDRRLTMTLADKVVDLLLRKDYGQMPVLSKVVKFSDLEEFNTTSIDMGQVGNRALPVEYYNADKFQFTNAYFDFIHHIVGSPQFHEFNFNFPKVEPKS
jgi:ATP-dependent phosphofructokinase / diphosphate-dependent phosphofructokinase